MNRTATLLCLAMASLALLGCAGDPVAGGGTDVDNARTIGILRYADGSPAAGADVRLIPLTFNPWTDSVPQANQTIATAEGRFELSAVAPGTYNIEARGPQGERALARGVVLGAQQTVVVPDDTLRRAASARITVAESLRCLMCRAFVPGTGSRARMDTADGTYVFDSLAAGHLGAIEVMGDNGIRTTIPVDIVIDPGETAVFAYGAWSYHRRVVLDVTSAGVVSALDTVPVLIRLDTLNFDFSRAAIDGRDVRVSQVDGAPIAFEIESWDWAGKSAVLWVLAAGISPVVPKTLFLHSGRPSAAQSSNGVAVFGARNAAVWHLSSSPEGGVVADACGRLAGVASGAMAAGAVVGGVAANGYTFDGLDDHVASSQAQPDSFGLSDITLSAWVRTSTAAPQGLVAMEIADRTGPERRLRMALDYRGRLAIGMFADDTLSTGWDSSGVTALDDGQWHHVCAVFDRAAGQARGYVDGQQEIVYELGTKSAVRLDGMALFAGYDKYISGSYLRGELDEVRVMTRVASADEILFAHRVEQEGSRAVTVGP